MSNVGYRRHAHVCHLCVVTLQQCAEIRSHGGTTEQIPPGIYPRWRGGGAILVNLTLVNIINKRKREVKGSIMRKTFETKRKKCADGF
jgi:hypothetical protein